MSTGNLLLDRQLARWYKLKDHPVQLSLVEAVREEFDSLWCPPAAVAEKQNGSSDSS